MNGDAEFTKKKKKTPCTEAGIEFQSNGKIQAKSYQNRSVLNLR